MPDARSAVARRLGAVLDRRCRRVTTDELRRSALVVAPHHDDETLGCGGTLAVKARLDAPISVLFMSDGAASHGGGVDVDELRRLRRAEAIAAGRELELDTARFEFVDLPDGNLSAHHAEAVEAIDRRLREQRPAQVFVPHRGDGHPDHAAITDAAWTAVRAVVGAGDDVLRDVEVLEYPVWHWQQWPWVDLSPPWHRAGWKPSELQGDAWRRSVAGCFGLRFPRSVNAVVDIEESRAAKRAAADCYATQMAQRADDADWATLYDVSGGDFIERLLAGREYFRVSSWPEPPK